jgi:hypothetical protein
MAVEIPYRYVTDPQTRTGWDWRRTAYEIYRDFEEVLMNVGGGFPWVTIAANDSDSGDKALADYVCNGSNDAEQWEAAFAEAIENPNGAVIYAFAGNYEPASTITLAFGAETVGVVVQGAGSARPDAIGGSLNVTTLVDGGSVSPLFQMTGDAGNDNGVIFRDIGIVTTGAIAVDTNDYLGVFAEDCYISAGKYGVDVTGQHFSFWRNYISVSSTTADSAAIRINTSGTNTLLAAIAENTLTNSGSGTDSACLFIDGGGGAENACTISDNRMVAGGSAYYGIRGTGQGGTAPSLIVIDSNRISGGGNFAGAANIRMKVDKAIISGNICWDCPREGIRISGQSSPNEGKDVLVEGNVVMDYGSGSANTYDGIRLEGDTYQCFVTSNHCRSANGRHGVRVDAGATDNAVWGNDLFGSGGSADFSDAGTNTRTVDPVAQAYIDAHINDTSDAHDASAISIADAGSDFTATDVEGALDELQADNEAHIAAADPHSVYLLKTLADAAGDILLASGADAWARLAIGTSGRFLKSTGSTAEWGDTHQTLGLWYQDNVAASQTNVTLNLYGDTTRTFIPVVRNGWVTGICLRTSTARTAGTLQAEVVVSGTPTGLIAQLDGTNTVANAVRQAAGIDSCNAGQRLEVRITSDASWAPTTDDISVSIEIGE